MVKNTKQYLVKININTLVYLALACYYLLGIFGETTLSDIAIVSTISGILNVVVILALIWKIVIQKYSASSLLRIAIFFAVFFLAYYLCEYKELYRIFLFVTAAKGIDMKKVAKQTIILTLAAILLVMLLTEIGFIEAVWISGGTSRTFFWTASSSTQIYLWGFTHHNFIGCRIMMCYTCYVFLRYEKYKIWDFLVGIVAFVFCYQVIKSRTTAFLIIITMILIIIFKLLQYFGDKKNKPLMKIGTYAIMIIAPVLSIVVSIKYTASNILYFLLDQIIYTRFSYANSIFKEYGLSLFGQNVELISTVEANESGVSAIVLDNAYMHLLIRCGLCVTVLVLLAWFLVARTALNEKKYSVAIIVAVYFICGISEKWLFTITYNPFVLFWSICLYSQNLALFDINSDEKKRKRIRFKINNHKFDPS